MSSTFLYKLFKHSKWVFPCVIFYMVIYFFCLYKKMDMAMFPYNNMYSNTQHPELTSCYLKINGQRVNYTHFMYWKKDFLEQSVTKYADYVSHNKINYLNIYINEKVKNKNKNSILQNALTPGVVEFKSWAIWYASYAGIKVQQNDFFELVKYKLVIENDKLSILDSNVLCSTKTQNNE